ncbi:MAG: hypothetical protein IJI26_13470 [Clostridia bacterium]|nr:hypothetical protein [Clostridia bacterium]
MESKRNFYYNTEGVNGMGGNSNIGPTMPDESYAPTEPDRSEQRRNRDDLNGRRVYDSGKPVTEIERTSVIEDEQLVVVGWLVSVSGDSMGKDFHLYIGENVIGRGRNEPGRVNLTDKNIHSGGELVLFYDPVNNQYTIRPKEGGNCLCYLNDTRSILEGLTLSPTTALRCGSGKSATMSSAS